MHNGLDLLLVYPAMDIEAYKKYFSSLMVDELVPRQLSPHIGIAYLLAVAKKHGIRAKFINMFVDGYTVDELVAYVQRMRPTTVGFTSFTTQIKEAAFIAEKIKEVAPHTRICVGGPHATAMPVEMLQEFPAFDMAVCGEAEETIVAVATTNNPQVLSNVVTRGKSEYVINRIRDLDSLPFPAWEDFDLSRYPGADPHCTKQELPMSTSRGCPGTCTFCARTFGRSRVMRSTNSVIAEMERNVVDFGCEALCFVDELFLDNPTLDKSVELFEAMIARGLHKKLKWSCEFRVDMEDPGVIELMRRAGCYYVFLGVESADEGIRHNIGKIYTNEQIKTTVAKLKEQNITCAASFILGLPGETLGTITKSIALAKELDVYSTTFPIAVPFPGTALRRSALKGQYGLHILSNDWSTYGKQYPGVMESDVLPIDVLRALQKLAYDTIPKKAINGAHTAETADVRVPPGDKTIPG